MGFWPIRARAGSCYIIGWCNSIHSGTGHLSGTVIRLLYIMLAFFRAFQWGKSIEYYSSILVAFSRKLFFFSEKLTKKLFFEEKMKTLRWLPTVLTVSTSKKRQTAKNELFDWTLGLSSWHSQLRLATDQGFIFRSYERIPDCCHDNN